MILRSRLWSKHLCINCQRNTRHFTVLAFETSADDTCAAIVTSEGQILSNIVEKQTRELQTYGGIHPYVAIKSHQRNLPGVVRRALDDAQMTPYDVDGISFTRGPGIGGCLSVSANAAKTLASALGKPIIGVHHMQAHALTPMLTSLHKYVPRFPYMTLLISGGHTMLVLTHDPRRFKILATTSDMSIGNAYDKVAKLLDIPPHPDGLGLGAALEEFCVGHPKPLNFKQRCMELGISLVTPSPRQLSFSYTGLHSTIVNFMAKQHNAPSLPLPGADWHSALPVEIVMLIAHAFQDAAVAQLEEKLGLALDLCLKRQINIQDVVVSGGVASNRFLRSGLELYLRSKAPLSMHYPPIELCTDNAAMIAWASLYRFTKGESDPYTIDLKPVWRIDEVDDMTTASSNALT